MIFRNHYISSVFFRLIIAVIVAALVLSGCPMPTAPPAMFAPTLVAGDGQLTASWAELDTIWNAVDDNEANAITAYNLRYSEVGSENWTEITSGITGTSHTITDLTNGDTYHVQVRAVNAQGTGGWSAFSTARPIAKISVPAALTLLTLEKSTMHITATWVAPTNDGGSPITAYDLRHSSDGGTTWTDVSGVTGTNHTFTVMTIADSYEVQVRAVNAQGDGPWSLSAELKFAPSHHPSKDFNTLDNGVKQPYGIWSDGTTMWVSDISTNIYAYDLKTKDRRPLKDITTTYVPEYIWSDGTTMFVTEKKHTLNYNEIHAHKLSDGAPDTDKNFNSMGSNGFGTYTAGIWSDEETMWLLGLGTNTVYTYNLSDRTRNNEENIDLDEDIGIVDQNRNVISKDMWSDGTTLWILHDIYDSMSGSNVYLSSRISAYDITTGRFDEAKTFELTAIENNDSYGIWSDGTTMWISNYTDDKLYAYDLYEEVE
ncbi:MAG: fibronectin type III domain-containing protein [Salinispira sp.]